MQPTLKYLTAIAVCVLLALFACQLATASADGGLCASLLAALPLLGVVTLDLDKLRDQRSAALKEARELVEAAEKEDRDLSEDEEKRYDALMQQAKDLEKRHQRAKDVTPPESPPAGEQRSEQREERFSSPNVQTQQRPQYSLLRALRCVAEKRAVDGFEGEVSQELAKRSGKSPQGFLMPFDMANPLEQRQLYFPEREHRAFDLTSGDDLKATVLDAGNFISLLRNAMVVRGLGARILTGLVGDLTIPSHTGAGTAYWFNSESATVTASAQTTGQVALAPNTVGAQTQISRKLMIQSTPDAEMLVREDLATVLALAIDLAALNGSGSGAEPEGILQNSSVPTVAIGANGGAPTWAKIVDLETEVNQDNALQGNLAYVTNAKAIGKLKTTEKASGYPVYLAEPAGADGRMTCNGYRLVSTNQIPSNLTKGSGTNLSAMIFGNWADVLLGFWSGVDVVADPYTQAASGALVLTMLQDCDVALRRTESFAKIVDLTT